MLPSDLPQNQMPATDQVRSGTDHGGSCQYMIFDVQCMIHTINGWLSFLVSNMYVKFSDQICCQIQDTPNCASHLADSCLAMHELSFITQCTWLHCISMLLLLSCAQSSMQWMCLSAYCATLITWPAFVVQTYTISCV